MTPPVGVRPGHPPPTPAPLGVDARQAGDGTDAVGTRAARQRRSWFWTLLLVVVAATGIAAGVGAAVWLGAGPALQTITPWGGPAPPCNPTAIEVVTAPGVEPAVTAVLAGVQGRRLSDGTCLQARVRVQAPTDTVASTRVLPVSKAPQIWVPDSSVWAAMVSDWSLASAGTFATSPLVVAGGQAALTARGWTTRPPSWDDVLAGPRPAAVPDLADHACGLVAVAAVWQRLGRTAAAKQVLAAAAVNGTRSGDGGLRSVLDAARDGRADGAVVVTSEAAVFAANRAEGARTLVAVHPEASAAFLDYPILLVAPKRQDVGVAAAAAVAVGALRDPAVREVLGREGLRDPQRRGLSPVAGDQPALSALVVPTGTGLAAYLAGVRAQRQAPA